MKKIFYILVFFISSFLSNNLLGNDKIYETYSNMFFIYSDEYVRVDENNLNNIKDDKYRKNLEQTVIQGMSSFEKFEMYVDKSSYNLSLDSYENERVPFFSVRTTIYEPEAVEKIKGQFVYSKPNFNYTENTLFTSVKSSNTDQIKDFGYETTDLGFSVGTRFEQYENRVPTEKPRSVVS